VTLPDGSVKEATAWETSPMDIAKSISQGLAQRVVIAKVCFEVILPYLRYLYTFNFLTELSLFLFSFLSLCPAGFSNLEL
jgi:hypothetical protein